jgi:hypothetical protein
MILFSILMGWTSHFLTGRVGNPYSMETAIHLMDEMVEQGTVINDEDEVRSLLYTAIYSEVQRQGDGMIFGYFVMGLNGVVVVVFGVWPSRKKRAPMLDTGE